MGCATNTQGVQEGLWRLGFDTGYQREQPIGIDAEQQSGEKEIKKIANTTK